MHATFFLTSQPAILSLFAITREAALPGPPAASSTGQRWTSTPRS
jgi:hypothetical protein